MTNVPVVFARWESFIRWLMERTAGFPKRLRHTLTHRIEARALDVYEQLAVARYAPARRRDALDRVSADVDVLRLLLRLARDLRCLSVGQADTAFEHLDEVGRMVGGWRRHAG